MGRKGTHGDEGTHRVNGGMDLARTDSQDLISSFQEFGQPLLKPKRKIKLYKFTNKYIILNHSKSSTYKLFYICQYLCSWS